MTGTLQSKDLEGFDKVARPEPPAHWPEDKKKAFREAAAKITIRPLTDEERTLYRTEAPFMMSYEGLTRDEMFLLGIDTADIGWSMVARQNVKNAVITHAIHAATQYGGMAGAVVGAFTEAKRQSALDVANAEKAAPLLKRQGKGRSEGSENEDTKKIVNKLVKITKGLTDIELSNLTLGKAKKLKGAEFLAEVKPSTFTGWRDKARERRRKLRI